MVQFSDLFESHDNGSIVELRMHEYMRHYRYKYPESSLEGPYQWALGTSLSYFEHIHTDSERTADFNACMSGNRARRRHWLDWFPFESELLSGASDSTERTLLVDVGGGDGHDLKEFLTRVPSSRGHLVLQDLPATIKNIKPPDGIQAMAHDFFKMQPIKGTRNPK